MYVHIRWMIRRDLPDVLVADAGTASPLGEQEILRQLRDRNCIGMVAESGDRVVGFMIYQLHKKRLEVVTLAVAPRWRNRGVGRALLAKLARKLSPDRRSVALLDVPEHALDVQKFLRACGVPAVAVVRHGCDDGSDVYRFRLTADAPVGRP